MKHQIHHLINWRRIIPCLLVILIFGSVVGCGPAPAAPAPAAANTPGVQVITSDWKAQRYGTFDKVWGSWNTQLQLDRLYNTPKQIVLNGYVTTDANGQGMMKNSANSACVVYVFQKSYAGVTNEAISTCPRGSTSTGCTRTSTWLLNNCKIRAVTLPATVKFKGTMVTIIEYLDLEVTVILSSEGVAEVTPTDQPDQYFEVNPGLAAYAVTPEFRQQAEDFFGFPAGVEVGFDAMVGPIERMDQAHQIQSANLILQSQGLPFVPLAEPVILGLRWLNEQPEDFRVSEAMATSIDWAKLRETYPDFPIPAVFEAQGQTLDLRTIPFDIENARRLLAEAGYGSGLEMYIVYDESIPGLADIAYAISSELTGNLGFAVTVQSFNADNAERVFAELDATKLPVLVLSGY